MTTYVAADELASRRIDRACAADARWFRRHPDARWFWRDLTPGERPEMAAAGLVQGEDARVRVRVTDLGRGRHERAVFVDRRLVGAVLDEPGPGGWGR